MPTAHQAEHAFERTPGAATRPLPPGYRPRRPATTAFYRVIADHLETMLQDARDRSPHGFGLPRHVERSFRRYLDCGIIERGFARVFCDTCRYEVLVPFSCKVRALCPSCDGRRMAAGACHLVDRVLPSVADYRQWTLSFPRWLRIRLLRDPALVSAVLGVFVRIVFAYHRRRARERGVAGGQTGAVTQIQLGGSFANANPHFHTLVPEGVWHESPDGSIRFHPLPPPTDEDIEMLAGRIVRRTARLLARRDADRPDDEPPDALAHAQAESMQLTLAGSGGGHRTPPTPTPARRRCALVDGFSLHANTSVDAADRAGLERLARYLLRPLISADRLTLRPDGRVEYQFRRPDPTGRTSWVTDGPTWCRRLATLIPPSRSHLTRFHGVLSSAHKWRSHIVPAVTPAVSDDKPPTAMILAHRLDWASLLRRVFGESVTQCPRCGDPLRVLAFITDPRVTEEILDHLGLVTDIPAIAPARAPPDDDAHPLDFDS